MSGMLNKTLHIKVACNTAAPRSVPCNILVTQANVSWYADNERLILSELCQMIAQDYKNLEDSAQQQDFSRPPQQLFGSKVRIAYISKLSSDGCSYKLVCGNNALADGFTELEMSSFSLDPLWIFPLDESDSTRHNPLPI